jgi:hypothetical protein
MKYIIKQSQLAALKKALAKINKAEPGEVVGLTEAEWEAYHNQSPIWEGSKAVPEKEDKTLARLVRRNNENPAQWSAAEWGYANRPLKEHLALRASIHNKMDINAGWTYQVEEREVQDGEEY